MKCPACMRRGKLCDYCRVMCPQGRMFKLEAAGVVCPDACHAADAEREETWKTEAGERLMRAFK